MKNKIIPDKKPLIFHPFITAIYPILFYYNLNKHELWFFETLVPMALSLLFALLLFLSFKLIFKNTIKAGVLTSFILVLFFFYEAILTSIGGNSMGVFVVSLDQNLFWSYGFFLVLFALGVHLWEGNYYRVTRLLNIVAIILIIFPLASLAFQKVFNWTSGPIFSDGTNNIEVSKGFKHTGLKRDIYYFILDGYMRDDALADIWGYDNSEFIQFLKSRGFYVASKSRSNYPYTILSLPSSLNMKYLNPEGDVFSDSRLPLIKIIDDNKVVKLTKALGYKYIHLSDGTAETKFSRHADIRLTNRKYLSSFFEYLINKTLLKSIKFSVFDPIKIKRDQILFAFKSLGRIPDIKEPTFTFAHIVAPHEPFVFDKNGGIPLQDKINRPLKYFQQALFINKQMMPLLDNILNRSNPKPIIIIQGDHGIPFRTTNQPKAEQLKKSFSILNAYHFPEGGDKNLYNTITPVNSFRLLFNHYFGTKMELLEDETYFPLTYTKKSRLISIPKESALEKGDQAWIDHLKSEIHKNPNFAEAYTLLGWYYFKLKRFPDAVTSLKEALNLDPNLTWAYINLGTVYKNMKSYSEAFETIHQAMRINPKIAFAHKVLGDLQMETGNYQEAISAYTDAIRINPNYFGAMNRMARVYLSLNNQKQSISYFKKAVKVNPTFPSYSDLILAYGYFNLYEEAMSNLNKALEIFPNMHPKIYSSMANIYVKKKNYKEAIHYYQRAIKLKPDLIQAHYHLGSIYGILRNPQKSEEYFQKTLNFNPKHTLAHFGLGNTFSESNQMQSAISEYKMALKTNPDHIPSYTNMGNAQMQLGRFDQARKTYETALLKQPGMAQIHKNLGIIFSQSNMNTAKAIFHFSKSLELSPNQPDAQKIQSTIQALRIAGTR